MLSTQHDTLIQGKEVEGLIFVTAEAVSTWYGSLPVRWKAHEPQLKQSSGESSEHAIASRLEISSARSAKPPTV